MLSNQKLNSIGQFALLIGFVGVGMVLLSLIMGLLARYALNIPLEDLSTAMFEPRNIDFIRVLQIFSSFLMWGVPALAVAAISGPKPVEQLGYNETMSGKQVFLVVLMIVAGIALGGALGELNRMIPLTEELNQKFKVWEENYSKQVMSIANMKNVNDYLFTLLILAITPALFEEMFFRGCMQQILVKGTGSAFAGILITSIIFSAVHLSFFGFLPRLFLGFLLGYIFHYSKNLWLPVIAHFLNNAFGVTVLYSLSRSGKLTPDAMDDTYPYYYGVIAAMAIIVIFIAFKKESTQLLKQQ
ncbi:CPBP family intramembrane metalloprotease [Panacibacter sp. DH6]|uniref:CPBP family intramembrane metalloprotease n=1 Tax=Panacibacter microcysteis TaxID=2793269 RepID=A0A931GT69_9BACT|nr:CPBP family intramembrane glutamic endopeptidase [Panacibacter microcysteis]MBG9375206.1 CPBP family intramembrane metalloprotease [Panacibacter microcysteis]